MCHEKCELYFNDIDLSADAIRKEFYIGTQNEYSFKNIPAVKSSRHNAYVENSSFLIKCRKSC